jgi:putative ABC transport system permease protein
MPPRSGALYSFFDFRFSLPMPELLRTFRSLWRTPGFTVVVVLVLALGIGANTALFSVVDAALLKPMPIPQPERVVQVSGTGRPGAFIWFNQRGFEVWPAFMDATSFDAVSAYVTGELNLHGFGRGRVRAAAVTPEFFDVLAVPPVLGRVFNGQDVAAGSFDVALISQELWQSTFESAPDILGRKIVLNRQTFIVLGVMPRGIDMPQATEIWVPSYWGRRVVRGRWVLPIVAARLAAGVTPAHALDEIAKTAGPLGGKAPAVDYEPQIASLRDTLVGETGTIILFLAAGALVVLLVACTNIASLLLTRVSARQREFAVRRALGAGDRDIARQILAESLLLSALAFLATIPVAMWTLHAIRAWVPVRMYGASDIAVDARALAAAVVLSLATAMLFSAAPLWSARGRSALDALRSACATTADPRWRRFRSGLAIAEISFALVLLAGAVTVIRTVASLMAVDLGVRAERVLVVGVDWPSDETRGDRRLTFLKRYEEAFGALPGVESVGITSGVPGAMGLGYAELIVDGLQVPDTTGYIGSQVMASPQYFSIMGVELVAGRLFTERDHFFAPKVAIVSETFARRYRLRPDEIVGRRAVLDHRWVDIVGVVKDIRPGGPSASLDATAYVPFAQRQDGGPLQFVVQTQGDPNRHIAAVGAAAARIDPNVSLYDIRTFDQIRAAHLRDRRFVMTMLSWFGGLAFVLAVLGLYAVVSYLVHLRTREIGIRMAMGATIGTVRVSVIANGVAHCLAGVLLGAALALGLSQLLSSRLRDLGQLDFVTLLIVSIAFLSSAALAAWLPARRATRIDPVQALRFE